MQFSEPYLCLISTCTGSDLAEFIRCNLKGYTLAMFVNLYMCAIFYLSPYSISLVCLQCVIS